MCTYVSFSVLWLATKERLPRVSDSSPHLYDNNLQTVSKGDTFTSNFRTTLHVYDRCWLNLKRDKSPKPRMSNILFPKSVINELKNMMQDVRVRLRLHESYRLREESGVETAPATRPLNIFHNI